MRRCLALFAMLGCALAATAAFILPAAAVSTKTFSLSPTGPNSTALIVEPGVGNETVKFDLQNLTNNPITITLGLQSAVKTSDPSTPYTYSSAMGFATELHFASPTVTLGANKSALVPVMVDRPRKNATEAYALITAEQVMKKVPTNGVSAVEQLQLFVVLKTGDPLAPAGSGNGASALLIIVAAALIALVVILLVYRLRRRRETVPPDASPTP